MQIKKFILPLIILLPVIIIQSTVIPFISINDITPDLVLILLVYFVLRTDQLTGTILGFLFGVAVDLLTGGLLGSAMLSKTISAFVAGYFSNQNKLDIYLRAFNFFLIILLCSIIDSTISSLFTSVDLSKNIFLLLYEQGFLPAFYTATLGLLISIFLPKNNLS